MSQQLSRKRLKNFAEWLPTQGARVLAPANDYEVIRFERDGQLHIIQKNDKGSWTNFLGDAAEAHKAFCKGRNWSRSKGTKLPKPFQRALFVCELIERDGLACFYCKDPLNEDNISVEHLVARVHKGPNHVSNMVLAHRACNTAAGTLSVMDKIRLREVNYGRK